jgi:hypothetical protein
MGRVTVYEVVLGRSLVPAFTKLHHAEMYKLN